MSTAAGITARSQSKPMSKRDYAQLSLHPFSNIPGTRMTRRGIELVLPTEVSHRAMWDYGVALADGMLEAFQKCDPRTWHPNPLPIFSAVVHLFERGHPYTAATDGFMRAIETALRGYTPERLRHDAYRTIGLECLLGMRAC